MYSTGSVSKQLMSFSVIIIIGIIISDIIDDTYSFNLFIVISNFVARDMNFIAKIRQSDATKECFELKIICKWDSSNGIEKFFCNSLENYLLQSSFLVFDGSLYSAKIRKVILAAMALIFQNTVFSICVTVFVSSVRVARFSGTAMSKRVLKYSTHGSK